jgi:hypothetical protein
MVHLVVLTAPQHTVRHNDQELLKSAEVTEHSNTKGPDPENQAHSRLSGNTISRSTLNLQGCGESGALTVHIHYRCQRTLRPLSAQAQFGKLPHCCTPWTKSPGMWCTPQAFAA